MFTTQRRSIRFFRLWSRLTAAGLLAIMLVAVWPGALFAQEPPEFSGPAAPLAGYVAALFSSMPRKTSSLPPKTSVRVRRRAGELAPFTAVELPGGETVTLLLLPTTAAHRSPGASPRPGTRPRRI